MNRCYKAQADACASELFLIMKDVGEPWTIMGTLASELFLIMKDVDEPWTIMGATEFFLIMKDVDEKRMREPWTILGR